MKGPFYSLFQGVGGEEAFPQGTQPHLIICLFLYDAISISFAQYSFHGHYVACTVKMYFFIAMFALELFGRENAAQSALHRVAILAL